MTLEKFLRRTNLEKFKSLYCRLCSIVARVDTLEAEESEGVTVAVKAANYTAGTDDPDEVQGGIIYVTSAATITLPAVEAGMSVIVKTVGNVAVSVDPNAADLIYLDGVPLDDGDKITNLSTAGDEAIITYYSGAGWFASTNGWTDGGA